MRFGFLWKGAVLVVLVILFDRLFVGGFDGARIGLFAAAAAIGLLVARRDVRRSGPAKVALGAALLFAAALFDDPGPLAWVLFWGAVSMAALLPRTGRFDDAWHWGWRLGIHALSGVATPGRDLFRLTRRRRAEMRWTARTIAATLALPLIGGGVFVILFANANPLIAQALAAISLPSFWQVVLWTLLAICIWPALRPHPATIRLAATIPDPEPRLPGTSLPSVLIALALFNAIFAIQNLLDITFLWSGAALPAGTSQTDYVHQGAYPLIVTTLLAGLLSLAMLRPGGASADHPLARRLVTLWVVQNLVLVASSALRTVDYIEGSMLTTWRIAALAWMAVVAFGLASILWRILRGRSARWLVNINALVALAVLVPCTVVDLGAVVATWNVRSATPEQIDLCYLDWMGDSALLPLVELERRRLTPTTREKVVSVRESVLTGLQARQADAATWTPRGARRLAAATAQLGPDRAMPTPLPRGSWRRCDGTVFGTPSDMRP